MYNHDQLTEICEYILNIPQMYLSQMYKQLYLWCVLKLHYIFWVEWSDNNHEGACGKMQGYFWEGRGGILCSIITCIFFLWSYPLKYNYLSMLDLAGSIHSFVLQEIRNPQ
jgi:hypothetical protein